MEQYRIRSISKANGDCFMLETEVCDLSFACSGDVFMRVRPIPGDVFWVHLGKICFVAPDEKPELAFEGMVGRHEYRISELEKRLKTEENNSQLFADAYNSLKARQDEFEKATLACHLDALNNRYVVGVDVADPKAESTATYVWIPERPKPKIKFPDDAWVLQKATTCTKSKEGLIRSVIRQIRKLNPDLL